MVYIQDERKVALTKPSVTVCRQKAMYAMLTILEEKNYKLATFIVLQLDLNMIVLI